MQTAPPLDPCPSHAGGAPPAFSVVVPLQDEEDSVVELLESLRDQTLRPAEAVLVDAGSLDRTTERARGARLPFPIVLVGAGRIHPGLARNEGVARGREAWIAFTDGGVRLDARWLEALGDMASGGVDAVFGDYDPVCPSFFTQCAALAYVPARGPSGTRGESVASCAIRREAFDAVGGFTAGRAAEDLIFIEAVLRRFRVAYAPSARVRWQIAGDWRRTYARFAEYSWHNLAAGRARHWHLGVARLYLALGLGLISGAFLGFGPWITVLIPAFFIARALKAAWLKRRSFEFQPMNPARVLGAAGVLLLIDVATLVGAARWLLGRGPRPSGT